MRRRAPATLALDAVVAGGFVLRLWQYLADASLWFDEAALALSIVTRPLAPLLTQPLLYAQSAPRGFLAVERLMTALAGSGDRSLRLLPFACSALALVVFRRLAVRLLDPPGALVAVAAFAFAPGLVHYAAQVKPYAGDVLAAVALTLAALDVRERRTAASVATAAGLGIVALMLSQAAVLVVAGIGVALVGSALLDGDRRALRLAAILSGAWGVAAAAALWVATRTMTPDVHAFMRSYWATGFVPRPLSVASALRWLWNEAAELARFGAGAVSPRLAIAASGAGGIALWRRRRDAALILAGPALTTLGAALVRQYPFSQRLILFLLPALAIGVGAAAGVVAGWLETALSGRAGARDASSGSARWLVATAAAALIAAGIAKAPPPYRIEEIRPALEYARAHVAAADDVYVFHAAGPAYRYYAPIVGLPDGRIGVRHRSDARGTRSFGDVDSLVARGRTWVVVSHAAPDADERLSLLAHLDSIAVRRAAAVVRLPDGPEPPNAEAYLYEPARAPLVAGAP